MFFLFFSRSAVLVTSALLYETPAFHSSVLDGGAKFPRLEL